MRQRTLAWRLELAPELNIIRVYRWIRTYGRGVRPAGKMERRIRMRGAFKKPGGRRSIFKARRAGA